MFYLSMFFCDTKRFSETKEEFQQKSKFRDSVINFLYFILGDICCHIERLISQTEDTQQRVNQERIEPRSWGF